MKISIIILISICLFACSEKETTKQSRVQALPYYNEATFTPRWLKTDALELDTFHKVSSFELLNQDGEKITQNTFKGKIYVTDFFFTSCPGICPKMTANMSVLQDEFLKDKDVLLLSHSVTPTRDSVPILKEYAEDKGIVSGKWHLATGTQEEIYKLGRLDYFVEEDLGLEKDLDEFLHTENFVLIDHNLNLRGIYNGLNKASVDQLIADIKTLKKEM